MSTPLPVTQRAIQLLGPRQPRLNPDKPVYRPGPRQLLCQVEAAGLCFSDLKLMNQFAGHPRKRAIASGIDPAVLAEIPSYVPGDLPTVPGHEAVVRVCAVGEGVERYRPGERYLVETDYRWLPTDGSNASFGYNFEGALQQYVLMDERVITSPGGESMLLPASDRLPASAVALVEPWACVENAYAEKQRRALQSGGRMLVVTSLAEHAKALSALLDRYGRPASVVWVGPGAPKHRLGTQVMAAAGIGAADDEPFDDIVYLGASADMVEALFRRLAPRGVLSIALCGGRLGRPVSCPVGRIHYGGIRIIGVAGCDPVEALAGTPASGEVTEGSRVHIVGAAGPMGIMHVVRVLCADIPRVSVVASDTDDARLEALSRIARPLAQQHGVPFRVCNPARERVTGPFDYIVLMVPAPALVAQAVEQAAPQAIINIFAGIPAEVTVELDLNAYIEKQLYLIGTSGSLLEDMKAVLANLENGRIDTNLSVAAISGLDGAIAGIEAIEQRTIPGKVIVYPWCRGLGLTRLDELGARLPRVAEALDDGRWTRAAEARLADAFGWCLTP